VTICFGLYHQAITLNKINIYNTSCVLTCESLFLTCIHRTQRGWITYSCASNRALTVYKVVSICDSDSRTETKNWRGRNKLLRTLAGLHPSWPQNKRLRTPWTTDWMHTRQDRWVQTELAFTLAKNATKPNPFEIISLQTTRKENNWKTEETLGRAVVTLETERIKGSNPWCLWWWCARSTTFTIYKEALVRACARARARPQHSSYWYKMTGSSCPWLAAKPLLYVKSLVFISARISFKKK